MPADSGSHWLIPQLLDPKRLSKIRDQLIARADSKTLQSERQALLGIQADGSHLARSSLDKDLFALLTDPALIAAVKRVSGCPMVRPFQFDLLTKAPGAPETPWHRDRDFLPIDRQSYTCWIPLDPIPEDCTLVYAEGTASMAPTCTDMPDPASLKCLLENHGSPFRRLPEMKPGDVDIHEGHVWHFGPANSTPHWRRALGVAFVEHGTLLCTDPEGFSGPAGARMRRATLHSLFGPNAEGQPVEGERHPLL
jgi:hypothetical protein